MQKVRLKVQEVAVLVDVSVKTLDYWYMFKRQNPRNQYAKMIPKYETKQINGRFVRLWTEEDVEALKHFKESIPRGRNGFMGSVTNKKGRQDGKN